METTIRPIGNSDCIQEAGLSKGYTIEIKWDSEKNIIISKVNERRSLAEIIGDWKAPEDYELCDFGDPVGREVW